TRNQLENAIYQAEKMKSDHKDKLSDEDKKVLDEAIAEAKKNMEATEKEELEKAAKELSDRIMPIGAKMYEEAEKEEKPTADDESESKKSDKDEPVEGEVVDDKKEK
ncbi:MAG: Hsp70 family protein, partial [Candidatus Saccharimonadales bacterium]